MVRFIIAICASFFDDLRCRSGSRDYDHPAHCSPVGTIAAICRAEFEFLPLQEAYGGFKQIAASEAAGVSTIWQRPASRGCGSSRPTGAALCRAIVLRRILI
jgi:hypothetical protein